jgi:hypothetical protein
MRAWWALILITNGCVYDELTAKHVEPGGAVHVTVNGGLDHTSTAIADATSLPLTVNGFAANLTFGLVAADDGNGHQPGDDLIADGSVVELPITAKDGNRLQVHLDGTGCDAQSGGIHLTSTGDTIDGDFTVDGVVTDGSGAACQITGTLSKIPVDR